VIWLIKLLIFDFDGTLFDAKDYFHLAFGYIGDWLSKDYGIEKGAAARAMEKVLEGKGVSYKKIFNDSFAALGLKDEGAVRKAVELFHRIPLDGLKPYPDVAVLKQLKEQYDIAIVTQGSRVKQERKIAWFGLDKVVDEVVYAQDVGYLKPDPRLYEEVLERFGHKASESMVVGDNPIMDFPGAKALGIMTCRVVRGDFADVPDICCDIRLDSLKEVREFLEKA
jgi:HAD superfamily hydrolase (TIGR01509 family)